MLVVWNGCWGHFLVWRRCRGCRRRYKGVNFGGPFWGLSNRLFWASQKTTKLTSFLSIQARSNKMFFPSFWDVHKSRQETGRLGCEADTSDILVQDTHHDVVDEKEPTFLACCAWAGACRCQVSQLSMLFVHFLNGYIHGKMDSTSRWQHLNHGNSLQKFPSVWQHHCWPDIWKYMEI